MALMEKYHALKEHANTRSHNGKKSVIMEKLAAQMVSQFPELGTLGLTHKEVASKVAAVLKDYRAMLGYEHKLSGRSMWEVPPEELQTSALKTKHLPLSQQVFELVNALEGDRDIMRPVNVHDGNIRVPYRDVEEEGQDEEEEEVEEYDEDGDAEEKQAGGAGVGEEEAVEGASGAACSGRSGAKAGVRRKPFVMSHVQKMISTIDKLGDKMTAVSKDVQAAMTLNNNNLLSVLLTIAGPQHSGGGGYQQPGGGVGGGGFQQPGGRGGFQQQGGGGGFQQPGGGGGSQQQGGGGGFQQPGGGGGFQQQTGGGGFPHGGYQQHGNSDGFQQGGYQQGSDPEQIGGGGLHLEESMSSGFQEFF